MDVLIKRNVSIEQINLLNAGGPIGTGGTGAEYSRTKMLLNNDFIHSSVRKKLKSG